MGKSQQLSKNKEKEEWESYYLLHRITEIGLLTN